MKRKPYSRYTRKELMEMIREDTTELNKRIFEYRQSNASFKDVENNIAKIKEISGSKSGRQLINVDGKKRYREVEIGVGNITSKSKSELIPQARELHSFLQWDISTPEGQRQWEARETKEWKTFSKNFSEYGLSKEEWRDLVEVFGAVGESVLNQFGSGQGNMASGSVVREFKNASISGRANLVKEMRAVLKENEGKGKTDEDNLTLLREKLAKYNNEEEK